MIEVILKNILKEHLDCAVYPELPSEPAPKYVFYEKTGGHIESHITHATIAIQSVSQRLLDAIELNRQVKRIMLNELIKLDNIVKVELNSDYNFTNTQTKVNRYQAIFDITYYEED